MTDRTRDGIVVIEGLEVIRRRPAMYIGTADADWTLAMRLLHLVLDSLADDEPQPSAIRVSLYAEGDVVVAMDGAPLPIEQAGARGDGVSHPALYRYFMHLLAGGSERLAFAFGAILNAVSERLTVSTIHDGARYRVVFSRGSIVVLLSRVHCDQPEGTNWLVYRSDPTIVIGPPLTAEQARTVCARVDERVATSFTVTDRSSETRNWD